MELNHNRLCPFCYSALSDGMTCACGYQKNKSSFLPIGFNLNNDYLVGAVRSFNGCTAEYICLETKSGLRVLIKEYCPLLLAERDQNGCLHLTDDDNLDPYNAGMQFFHNRALALSGPSEDAVFIPVKDSFFENNTAYAVVDYHKGKTINDFIREGGRCSTKNAKAFAVECLKELYAFHNSGVIHGNISSKTVFLSEGRLVIDGFAPQSEDLSLLSGEALQATKEYEYLPLSTMDSPSEQPATDIFAMGALLYTMITGKKPTTLFSSGPRLDSGLLKKTCENNDFANVILNLCGEGEQEYVDTSDALAELGFVNKTVSKSRTPQPKQNRFNTLVAVFVVFVLSTLLLLPCLIKETPREDTTIINVDDESNDQQSPGAAARTTDSDASTEADKEVFSDFEESSGELENPTEDKDPYDISSELTTEKSWGQKIEWYSEQETETDISHKMPQSDNKRNRFTGEQYSAMIP